MENLKCLFANFPWDIFLFWLLPLLLLWWWLWSRANRYKAHAEELQNRINFLEGELEACRKSKKPVADTKALDARILSLETDLDACRKSKVNVEGVAAAAAGDAFKATNALGIVATPLAAAAVSAKSNKKDDLKVVEGIGPKIAELCNNADIYTFADLANTSIDKLKKILDDAGPRYQMHDPTTWPQQAELARDGKWDELKKWQDELDKGKV